MLPDEYYTSIRGKLSLTSKAGVSSELVFQLQ